MNRNYDAFTTLFYAVCTAHDISSKNYGINVNFTYEQKNTLSFQINSNFEAKLFHIFCKIL